MSTIQYYLTIALAGIISLTLHEYAHGFTAKCLGDNTAQQRGRLTLNPLKHIDIIGLISVIIFKIGWAKPVPINPFNFKNRKLGTVLVSIAGPLTNFMLAIISSILFKLSTNLDILYMSSFLFIFMQINIAYGVFNLIPIPPLDGSKIIISLLPPKYEMLAYKYERYTSVILLVLYFMGLLDIIIYPMINFVLEILI